MSRNGVKKGALSQTFTYGGENGRRRRWSREHPIYTLVLFAFVLSLNLTIVVKCAWPLSFSSLLARCYTAIPSFTSAEPQTVLGAKERHGTWPVQVFKTEEFLAPDMTVSIAGSTSSGYLFIDPWGNGTTAIGPSIITNRNELIWHGPVTDSTNLRVQSLHGSPVLTYWNGTSTATFGHACGRISVLDDTYTKVADVCMKDLDLRMTPDMECSCYLDMHESYLTDHGTVIATAYNVTRYNLSSVGGPENGWIFDSLFYEIDIQTEEVLFRWRSLDQTDDIPITDSLQPFEDNGSTGDSERSPWDYFHINSVQPLEDGYLVNARHTFAMYKIDKTGKVEWQLQGIHGGDFSLAPGLRFSWQHHPRLISRLGPYLRLSLYNNDNSKTDYGTHETTALDITLNLAARTAAPNRRLVDPADPIFSASQGSHQPLPGGHALVGYGQVATVKEFDAAGRAVFSARFGASTSALLVASYRAHRYEWRATPASPPKVAAESSGLLTNVYMSWNGATDVHRWAVRAGASPAELELVATVPKSGFETEVSLHGAFKYVQVEAVLSSESGGAMRALRSSAVQRVRRL